jgi:hypothetical protein
MLTGAALVAGYALLGSTWLILKTEGRVQALARQMTRPLVVAVIAAMGLVSSWLPFLDSRLMDRWFSDGNFWWLSPVPLLTLAVAAALWRSATHPRRDLPPFLLSLALFVLGFLGLVLGMWPYLLPPSMTLWQAAAPASSLGFTLVGLVILLPVILGYTAWSYRVFRGKVHADTGYHWNAGPAGAGPRVGECETCTPRGRASVRSFPAARGQPATSWTDARLQEWGPPRVAVMARAYRSPVEAPSLNDRILHRRLGRLGARPERA